MTQPLPDNKKEEFIQGLKNLIEKNEVIFWEVRNVEKDVTTPQDTRTRYEIDHTEIIIKIR